MREPGNETTHETDRKRPSHDIEDSEHTAACFSAYDPSPRSSAVLLLYCDASLRLFLAMYSPSLCSLVVPPHSLSLHFPSCVSVRPHLLVIRLTYTALTLRSCTPMLAYTTTVCIAQRHAATRLTLSTYSTLLRPFLPPVSSDTFHFVRPSPPDTCLTVGAAYRLGYVSDAEGPELPPAGGHLEQQPEDVLDQQGTEGSVPGQTHENTCVCVCWGGEIAKAVTVTMRAAAVVVPDDLPLQKKEMRGRGLGPMCSRRSKNEVGVGGGGTGK